MARAPTQLPPNQLSQRTAFDSRWTPTSGPLCDDRFIIEIRTEKESLMVDVALFVRLEAKPGKESDVAQFLRDGLAIVEAEPATTAWFAIQLGPSTFGIFDAFPNEGGRQAHLTGRVAAALMARASELFAKPPSIEKVDVLAAKLPK
jgi:quinol monooxygenase YgiN